MSDREQDLIDDVDDICDDITDRVESLMESHDLTLTEVMRRVTEELKARLTGLARWRAMNDDDLGSEG